MNVLSPRTGRPPLHEQSRNKQITIRLSETELEELERIAAALSISRTDAIVQGLQLLSKEIE